MTESLIVFLDDDKYNIHINFSFDSIVPIFKKFCETGRLKHDFLSECGATDLCSKH